MKHETYKEMKKRIDSFSIDSILLNENHQFVTNDKLKEKIDESGSVRPYCGNTVVFGLKQMNFPIHCVLDSKLDTSGLATAMSLNYMIGLLYDHVSDMLSQPLDEGPFHMTLHDLLNGKPTKISRYELNEKRWRAEQLIEQMKTETWKIHMRGTRAYNMINTSIVYGLEPETEEDYKCLMDLYNRFDEIHPLDDSLTPHITLAYFRPGVYSKDRMMRLQCILRILSEPEKALHLVFTPEDLCYLEFMDMIHYFIPFWK